MLAVLDSRVTVVQVRHTLFMTRETELWNCGGLIILGLRPVVMLAGNQCQYLAAHRKR